MRKITILGRVGMPLNAKEKTKASNLKRSLRRKVMVTESVIGNKKARNISVPGLACQLNTQGFATGIAAPSLLTSTLVKGALGSS